MSYELMYLDVRWKSGGVYIFWEYHHNTKLYWKISWVCCRMYCYKCRAWVTMPTATNYHGDNDFIIRTFNFIAHSDIVRMTCSKNMAFYKLHTATRLPHWLPYIHVSQTYNNVYTSHFACYCYWRWKPVLKIFKECATPPDIHLIFEMAN